MVGYVLCVDGNCSNIGVENAVKELDGCKIVREIYNLDRPLLVLKHSELRLEIDPNIILAFGIYEIINFVKRANLRKYLLPWLLLDRKMSPFLTLKIEEKLRKPVYKF